MLQENSYFLAERKQSAEDQTLAALFSFRPREQNWLHQAGRLFGSKATGELVSRKEN